MERYIMSIIQWGKINHFYPYEITDTGATIESVDPASFHHLSEFRDELALRMKLLEGGITTGTHISLEHKLGKAFDFYLMDNLKPSKDLINKIIILAINHGFKGVGIYKNHLGLYSFHLDTRSRVALWSGTKDYEGAEWEYTNITFLF